MWSSHHGNKCIELSDSLGCGSRSRLPEQTPLPGRANPRALHWQQFDVDFAEFQTKVQDLDRRLVTIFCQGFGDCNSFESAVKVHMDVCSSRTHL